MKTNMINKRILFLASIAAIFCIMLSSEQASAALSEGDCGQCHADISYNYDANGYDLNLTYRMVLHHSGAIAAGITDCSYCHNPYVAVPTCTSCHVVEPGDPMLNGSEWNEVSLPQVSLFRVEQPPPPVCEGPAPPMMLTPFYGEVDVQRRAILISDNIDYPYECGEHMRTEWQISEDMDFGQALILHVATTKNLTTYIVPVQVLEPETSYYWRVKYIAADSSESAWSPAGFFTTAAYYDEEGIDGVVYVHKAELPGRRKKSHNHSKVRFADNSLELKMNRLPNGAEIETIQMLYPEVFPDSANNEPVPVYGGVSFRILVNPGESVNLNFRNTSKGKTAAEDIEWYSYDQENGWYLYEGVYFTDRKKGITIFLQDGGLGDVDGVVNGIIVSQ